VDDYEAIAQELSNLAEKIRTLEDRLVETERVNARLEDAALTMASALSEVSRHWDAVYEAMRRAERIDPESSSDRDHAASRGRHEGDAVSASPDQ
jgi:chromosome segregation ATPase